MADSADALVAHEQLRQLIRSSIGVELGEGKTVLVENRLRPRLRALGMENLDAYLERVQADARELETLIGLLTTHTTEWFRESAHFDILSKHLALTAQRNPNRSIQLWSAAASSGQEIYSMAMTAVETGIAPSRLRYLATDVDQGVLETAASGQYPLRVVKAQVHAQRVQRFFNLEAESDTAKVNTSSLGSFKFRPFNLISSSLPRGLEFDAIFLRNVLIYFSSDTVREVVDRVSAHLRPDGLLFVGHSEGLTGKSGTLEYVASSVYRKPTRRPLISSWSRTKELSSPRLPVDHHHSAVSAANARTSLLIVDDSKVVRSLLRAMAESDPGIEVIGEATSAEEALSIYRRRQPDAITLDLHMPGGSGLEFIRALPEPARRAIILVTDCSLKDSGPVFQALELGVFDYLQKPAASEFETLRQSLTEKIHSARHASMGHRASPATTVKSQLPALSSDIVENSLILLGASTGGTEALKVVLSRFPRETPPVIIVQHMPAGFTRQFAERLSTLCRFPFTEVTETVPVATGCGYLAPGNFHLRLRQEGSRLSLHLDSEAPINRFRPSVDALFQSATSLRGKTIVAALLTGMGDDGAKGLAALHAQGAHTIAQDKDTSVVFGMPKVAIELGGAAEVRPLGEIAERIWHALSLSARKRRTAQ